MTTRLDDGYRNEIVLALRLHDVPGPRIGEVLAEIESHVAETGEDPREAFGDAKAYAEEVAAALDLSGVQGRSWLHWTWSFVRRLDRRDLAVVALSFSSVMLLAQGLYGLGAGRSGPFGLPATTSVLLGLFGLGVLAVVLRHLGRQEADPVVDPRTGEDMLYLPRWTVALQVTVPLAALAGMYVLGRLVGAG